MFRKREAGHPYPDQAVGDEMKGEAMAMLKARPWRHVAMTVPFLWHGFWSFKKVEVPLLKAYPSVFMVLQYMGAAYLTWLGVKMIVAKPGAGPSVKITPGHYFRETLFITLLNPKAILFYLAFFPQFIDPVQHEGVLTFAVMALTIAVLGLTYCVGVVAVTHTMAERIRARPKVAGFLQKCAGLGLIGFGLKMVLVK
mgnify:CR=1 FL=1